MHFLFICFFRYVIDGRTNAERTLWVVSITASFTLAMIMIKANVDDVALNPIATSINTISLQVRKLRVHILNLYASWAKRKYLSYSFYLFWYHACLKVMWVLYFRMLLFRQSLFPEAT